MQYDLLSMGPILSRHLQAGEALVAQVMAMSINWRGAKHLFIGATETRLLVAEVVYKDSTYYEIGFTEQALQSFPSVKLNELRAYDTSGGEGAIGYTSGRELTFKGLNGLTKVMVSFVSHRMQGNEAQRTQLEAMWTHFERVLGVRAKNHVARDVQRRRAIVWAAVGFLVLIFSALGVMHHYKLLGFGQPSP